MKIFTENGDLKFSFAAVFWLVPAIPVAIYLSWALLSQYSQGKLDGFATIVGIVILWGYVVYWGIRLIVELWAFRKAQDIIRRKLGK